MHSSIILKFTLIYNNGRNGVHTIDLLGTRHLRCPQITCVLSAELLQKQVMPDQGWRILRSNGDPSLLKQLEVIEEISPVGAQFVSDAFLPGHSHSCFL